MSSCFLFERGRIYIPIFFRTIWRSIIKDSLNVAILHKDIAVDQFTHMEILPVSSMIRPRLSTY